MHVRHIEARIVARHDVPAHFGQRPGDLDARRAAPDDHDVESRYALGVRSGRHGQLEIAQDPVADVQRVGDV